MKSFHFDYSSVKHLSNFKYEKPSINSTEKKKFVMKSIRGDDRDDHRSLYSSRTNHSTVMPRNA